MKLLESIRAGIGALAVAGWLSLASTAAMADTRAKVEKRITTTEKWETPPGVTDPWKDIREIKPVNSKETKKIKKVTEHAFNALPNGGRDVKALQTYLGDKGYYQGNVDGDWGPNSQKALNAYERERGLAPSKGYSIPKVTYEALVGDMIKHRLELGLKVLNDKPALQAAYAIIFANRYGVSVKGTLWEEIKHIIGTVGIKVGTNGVFKVSAAHLEKFEKLYFDGVSQPVGTTLTQDAFWAEYTHKSSDSQAILQEVGGGVAFFDAKGKNLGKVADIIENGYTVGEIRGAWTGWQRFDVFAKAAFRLASNVRLDGTVGYYQSKERNALDYIGQRASGLTLSGKITMDLTQQDRIYGFWRYDGDNRWSVGGGYQRAIANGVQAWVEYRYDNATSGMAANHSIMARLNAQFSWGKDGIIWWDGTSTEAKLPPLFQNSTAPKPQERVELKIIEESPKAGLTFADLEPVYGVDTERIMVGRAVSQKILKQDAQTKITAPKITNLTATSVTCDGSIEDTDGVKEVYFELTGPEWLKRSTSCSFSGLTAWANYQVRIIGKTLDGKTGTWNDVNSSWVSFSTLAANHNPTANPDTASTEYNTPVTVNVIANDTDVDGDTLTILGTPTSSQWTVVVSGDKKSVTFTPNSWFSWSATVNYVVSDGKWGTANGVLTITVNSQLNHLPVFSSTIPNQTAMVGNVANTVLPVATDVDAGDTLTYSITGLPPWLTFAPATRTITGTLITAGIYNVTYSVTDGKGVTSQNFTITVNAAPDTSPDAFTFTDQTGVALSQLINSNEITVSGINTDTPISVSGGYYSINGGSWTPVAWLVKNGDKVRVQVMSSTSWLTTTSAVLTIGDKSDSFDVTTQAVNHAPTFNATVGNQTQTVGDSLNVTMPDATDVDSDTLTYSIVGLPTGLSFNASTRLLSGTFTTAGVYNVTYTVSDGKGGITNQNFTVTVNANNAPIGVDGVVDLNYRDTESDGLKTFTFSVTDAETPQNQLTIEFTELLQNYGDIFVNGAPAQLGVKYPITSTFQFQTRDSTSVGDGTDILKWKGWDKNGGNTWEHTTTFIHIVDV